MKKPKKYFFGKYYKLIADDGFIMAVIMSTSLEGDELQLISKDRPYFFKDKHSIRVENNKIIFDVIEENLIIKGEITFGELHPLSKPVMGWFRFFPLECKHNIYSMYHSLKGEITFNEVKHTFNNGYGYIEGDEGKNFPQKYIWYNSVKPNYGLTFAIATIPFGLIKFKGILCFLKTKDKEYYLCTYNCVKAKKISPEEIILKRGKYTLTLKISTKGGHNLKAPKEGEMGRYIKENVCVPTSFIFKEKDKIILEEKDEFSSLEYMFD